MTMMVTSREAIAHSRQLLVDLKAAHWPFFSGRLRAPRPT
jgi:hypothetical protein